MSQHDLSIHERKHHLEAQTEFNKTTRRRWYWKGNHKECSHSQGECSSKAGWTNSKAGQIVPQIAAMATGGRFQVTVQDESPNSAGDIEMSHVAKGFVVLAMEVQGDVKAQEKQRADLRAEIMEKVRPSAEVVADLRAELERDARTTAYEEKHTIERTDKDLAALLAKFDKAQKPEAANGRA